MNSKRLSLRLMSVAGMVSTGNAVYDIGCDHAYLSIYLVRNGIAKEAFACDVNVGPLLAARTNIKEAGLDDRIKTVLSDGLHNIEMPTSPSTLVIAGMGGPLIINILTECREKLSWFDEIIISPQSLIDTVRIDLDGLGLYICDEDMVKEDGKFYTIMKLSHEPVEYNYVLPGADRRYTDYVRKKFGPVLIDRRPEILREYLCRESVILKDIEARLDKDGHSEKYREVSEELRAVELLMGGLYGND